MIIRNITDKYLYFCQVYSKRLNLALKLQKWFIITKIQIKVVLLRVDIKLINIDEEKI